MGIDDSFHKGLKAYRDGNYPEAVQLLKNAVNENEGNHKAWNALGVTFSKMGRIEEAVSCYENALKYDPGNISYEQNRDQIVRKAFSRLPSSPRSEGLGMVNLNYRRFIIPAILLIFVAFIAIYILIISSSPAAVLNSGNESGSLSSLTPVPEITPVVTSEVTESPSDLQSNTSSPVPVQHDINPGTTAELSSPSLMIIGDLNGKYSNGLSELTFSIGIPDGGTPQYLPRVSYLWSAGSLDPVMVLPANPASGTIKPGETESVTLQIPLNQQSRSGEKFNLEIRPPSGNPTFFSSTLPDDYNGGKILNPGYTKSGSFSSETGSSALSSSGSSAPAENESNLVLEGSLNGFYSSELEELTLTLRVPTTGSPQDLTRITYNWNVGSSVPVKISRVQPVSGTINPGEQQLVTISIPVGNRPLGGESFTLEIKPDIGSPIVVKKALSSGYRGGIIP